MPERAVCPECGSRNWFTRNYDRLVAELDWKRRDCQKLARENGLLQYMLYEALEDVKRQTSTRDRKIDRQRRAIIKLEEKLRKRGEQPYA